MSAITFLPTPWLSSSRTRATKTSSATCESGDRAPSAVESCAINTMVWRTTASIKICAFIGWPREAGRID
jgi:hypothetical protein